jgi:hypothetical protein
MERTGVSLLDYYWVDSFTKRNVNNNNNDWPSSDSGNKFE